MTNSVWWTLFPSPPGAPPVAIASATPEDALDQLLRQIIEGCFVLTDGQGALSKWSEPAEMLFGYEADDALMEPFFGKLVPIAGLSPQGESWRAFLETGETPGASGRLTVEALRPDGGTFEMEAVFIPVKLDEGFDFSLFLEDLGFELPMDMMLLRMRQQHPVVVRALRSALEPVSAAWEGLRTAGTLVAFRALEPTPWMDAALARREAEKAEAEAEMQTRIEALEAPGVQGADVYDLDDARAVIDRLRWATERIEDLEERSRIADAAVQEAADARVRAEAAERAALDVRAEVSGVLAKRPVDASVEADRVELLARLERVERAAAEASEVASAQRLSAEAERTRATELEAQRSELIARLEQVEQAAGSTSVAEAAVADARAELTARMEALERSGVGAAAADAELVARLEQLERARAQEAEDLRAQISSVRGAAADRGEVETLHGQVAVLNRLQEELLTLRERADAQSAVIRRGSERETAAVNDAASARTELNAALNRIEELSEETARIRAQLESAPEETGLSPEERHKLEQAVSGVLETRAGMEAIRYLAEELRAEAAQTRDEGGRLQERLAQLADAEDDLRREREGARRDADEMRSALDELRGEREDVRGQLREAIRTAEEARALAERGPSADGDAPAPATADEVLAARARLDELAAQIEAGEARVHDARAEAAGARADVEEIRDIVRDAQKAARDAGERAEMTDRTNRNALAQISTQAAILEEVGSLARSAQQDAAEGRADAGEARAAMARLEGIVAGVREQVALAVADAAGAREQAAAAGETASSVREMAAGVGDAAREAAAASLEPVRHEIAGLRASLEGVDAAVAELRTAPHADPEFASSVESLRGEVRSLRDALDSAEGGDAAAVGAIGARLEAVEESLPKGLDARLDSLREGLAGALGKLEGVTADLAAARTETGAGRQAIEQRLADSTAELMAARTDAEQARRGVDALREEIDTLREYAAAAKAEAVAAREAAADAYTAGVGDDRTVHELRTEVQSAVAKLHEFRSGFEEARQAAVAARRDAEQARAAAEKAAVNEVASEKFAEVWQKMLHTAPSGAQRPGSGVRALGSVRMSVSKPKPPPVARKPEPGFDDDPTPLARLDLKGKFTQLNPSFVKLIGYQEHEFGKATWPSVLDRHTYHELSEHLHDVVAGRRESAEVNSTYMHSQGLMVLIRGALTLVRDEAGEPDHLLITAEPGGPGSD